MKINNILIFIDNLLNKLLKVASNGLSLVSNIIRLKKKDRIIDCKQKSYESLLSFGGCRCFLMDFENDGKIIYGDNDNE